MLPFYFPMIHPAPAPSLKFPATRRSRHVAIAPADRCVVKRDGTTVSWDPAKVARAVALAFYEVIHGTTDNPDRDNLSRHYGLNAESFVKVRNITTRVEHMLELFYRAGRHPSIEQIQDNVEKAIAAEGEWAVARAYIVYRAGQAARRLNHYAENGLADYIALAKYARYRPDLGRRELFAEAARRVQAMHRRFFRDRLDRVLPAPGADSPVAPQDRDRLAAALGGTVGLVLDRAFAAVVAKTVLPSMRSLQFGGEAILRNHARLFNCSFSPVDRLEFFGEYLFLLLAGTGCGFSVQRQHTSRLPALPVRGDEMELSVVHHTIADTIEGWADALHLLMRSHWERFKAEFNYSGVRPRGSQLHTSGGKAPGHLPLKSALLDIEAVLNGASGRQLRPVEIYDICMFAARSVLSGGIRRSATICLFSPDDQEMMDAKTGDWFGKHPQRSASNNSAVVPRAAGDDSLFRKLFAAQREFGEPGFYFADDPEYGCNPCCEIGLHPVVGGELDDEAEVARLRALGYAGPVTPGTRLSGWQMCNLSTINGAALTDEDDFLAACIHAAVVGTLQAAYTDIAYLGPVTRYLNERDALLGVSICGFMDNPELLFDPALLERGARLARAANRIVADALGIRPAARVTCVKPEGTASLLLGAASGIHPHHARHYFRRVQANRRDPVFRHFAAANPHLTETSVYRPDTDDVLTFAVEAPAHAILRDEIGALEFLRLVQRVQQHWVLAGEAENTRSPGLHHNVSHTCTVKPAEWAEVADFIWRHRAGFTGVALLGHDGDKRYAQAPREAVVTEDDVAKWNRLKYHPVDYTQLIEQTDETALKDVAACAGGGCEIL